MAVNILVVILMCLDRMQAMAAYANILTGSPLAYHFKQ